MLKNVLVFSQSNAELVSKANAIAENTVLITAAGGLTGADTVYTYDPNDSVAMKLKTIADIAVELQPELYSVSPAPPAVWLQAILQPC